MGFLPVFLDLSAGTVVLVGAGPQAAAKFQLLRAAGARVKWFIQDASADNVARLMPRDAVPIEVVLGEREYAELWQAVPLVSGAGG